MAKLGQEVPVSGKDVRLPSRDELESLLEPTCNPCVTIQFPTERVGRDTLKGPIQLGNSLKEAEERIRAQGLPKRRADAILVRARGLLEDRMYWQHLDEGLVLCMGEDVFHEFHVPFPVEEVVVVASRFHLMPLLRMNGRRGAFYVLSLAKNRARLYRGTAFGIAEVELDPDVPVSLDDEIALDVFERSITGKVMGVTTGARRSAGRRTAGKGGGGAPRVMAFDAHGGATDPKVFRRKVIDLLNHLDNGVRRAIGDPHAPLVVASVDTMRGYYRQASNYPLLVEEGIDGNFERARPEELHERAWPIVERFLARDEDRHRDGIGAALGTGLASADLEVVLPAARQGRIGALFLRANGAVWGVDDPYANQIDVHRSRREGDEDLLNVAAVETLKSDGAVYVVEREKMPVRDAHCAALFRY